jgi:phosphohistidine phosphatase
MGAFIAARGLLPEWVVASTAARVRQTVEGLIEPVDWRGEVHLSPRLYAAAPADILAVLQDVPDRVERVMVVGHNPGLEDLVRGLTTCAVTMPTAALAVIDGAWDRWGGLSLNGRAELVDLFKPKELDRV